MHGSHQQKVWERQKDMAGRQEGEGVGGGGGKEGERIEGGKGLSEKGQGRLKQEERDNETMLKFHALYNWFNFTYPE